LALYDNIYSEVYDSTADKNNQIALIIEAQDVSLLSMTILATSFVTLFLVF
jgi:hypothetical protein